MTDDTEERACVPVQVDRDRFNPHCQLPYGLKTEHIHDAMNAFVNGHPDLIPSGAFPEDAVQQHGK